jgi:hypothetical protein
MGFVGAGPFDVLAQASNVNWNSQEIVQVDGYINGVFYERSTGTVSDGWTGPYNALAWAGTAGGALFDLDATDVIKFIVHIRAV